MKSDRGLNLSVGAEWSASDPKQTFRLVNPDYRLMFESAMTALLNQWRVFCEADEIRALHIGFDSSNTEISISLLTDREPHLDRQGLEPLGDRWPVADWRLTGINDEWASSDMEAILAWMKHNAHVLNDEALDAFNRELKLLLFDVAIGESVTRQFERFRAVRKPLPVRVEWFYDQQPLDGAIK